MLVMENENRIETHRSGIFTFQVGLDFDALRPLMDRVGDAQKRFSSIPILPDISERLYKAIVVSSIYGTNTIEGGTLSEEETRKVIEIPDNPTKEEERRAKNIDKAYKTAVGYAEHVFNEGSGKYLIILADDMFMNLHKHITTGLTHKDNTPGKYRDNPKGWPPTKVGDLGHGGVYVPPKCYDDIKLLMDEFLSWVNSHEISGLSPLLRAPLVHYYFERIHPFWDGNGRVGRVVEAMILKSAGFKYAPFALARYYLENIDDYFTVFNIARKAEEGKEKYPNQKFVEFFMEGLLFVLNEQHDAANEMIGELLYKEVLRFSLDKRLINDRQYSIVSFLLDKGYYHNLSEIQKEVWYQALYKRLVPNTRARKRDLDGLIKGKLISIDKNGVVRLLMPGQKQNS